jgi:hypothetical protein
MRKAKQAKAILDAALLQSERPIPTETLQLLSGHGISWLQVDLNAQRGWVRYQVRSTVDSYLWSLSGPYLWLKVGPERRATPGSSEWTRIHLCRLAPDRPDHLPCEGTVPVRRMWKLLFARRETTTGWAAKLLSGVWGASQLQTVEAAIRGAASSTNYEKSTAESPSS